MGFERSAMHPAVHEDGNRPAHPEIRSKESDSTILATQNSSLDHDFTTFYLINYPDGDRGNGEIAVYFTDQSATTPYDANQTTGSVLYDGRTGILQSVRMERAFYPDYRERSPEVVWTRKYSKSQMSYSLEKKVQHTPSDTFQTLMRKEGRFQTFRLLDTNTQILKQITAPLCVPGDEITQAAVTANQLFSGTDTAWQSIPDLLDVRLDYLRAQYTLFDLKNIAYGKDGLLKSDWSERYHIQEPEKSISTPKDSILGAIVFKEDETLKNIEEEASDRIISIRYSLPEGKTE